MNNLSPDAGKNFLLIVTSYIHHKPDNSLLYISQLNLLQFSANLNRKLFLFSKFYGVQYNKIWHNTSLL